MTLSSPTAKSFVLNAQIGHSYKVYVRAHAGADYESTQKVSPAFKPTLVQDSDARVKYAKRWTGRSVNGTSAKAIKFTGDASGAVTMKIKATQFAWVTSAASNRGSARVYIDGKLITGVNAFGVDSDAAHRVRQELCVGGHAHDPDREQCDEGPSLRRLRRPRNFLGRFPRRDL